MSDYEVTKIAGSTGTQIRDEDGALIIDFDKGRKDPFDRLRVSNSITLFDDAFTYNTDFNYIWSTSVTGTGSVTHDATTGQRILSTGGTASGAKAILQSRRRIQYVKGKSQLIYLTGSFNSLQANVRKRFGYFDENNGVFFETNGTSLYVVRRTKTSGSVVDNSTVSTAWNLDRLDGSGDENNPSGLQANPTKHYLFIIDFSWLGSGVIRYGIIVEGKVIYVHQDNASGAIEVPWAVTAHLPVRYEIENTGTASATDSIDVTCAMVSSEGGTTNIGTIKTVSTGTTAVSVSATDKVVAGIRLKTTSLNAALKTLAFDLVGQSGTTTAYWKVIYNGTLAGDTWGSVTDLAEGLTNNPTYTAGTGLVLGSGYFVLGSGSGSKFSPSQTSGQLENNIFLGFDLAGVPDTVILTVRTISGTGSILFTGQFREFS